MREEVVSISKQAFIINQRGVLLSVGFLFFNLYKLKRLILAKFFIDLKVKTRYKYIILILLVYSGTLSAQSKSKNKFELSAQREEGDVLRRAIVNNLKRAENIFNDSIEMSLLIVERNLLIAIQNNFKKEEGLTYILLGEFNQQLGNFQLAISNYLKAEIIFSGLENQMMVQSLYSKIGECEKESQNYRRAISYFTKAKYIAQKDGVVNEQVFLSIELGGVYSKIKQYDKAKLNFEWAVECAEVNYFKSYQIEALMGLGELYSQEKEYDKAKAFFIEAQIIATAINSSKFINSSYEALTELYRKQDSLLKVLDVQTEAYAYNVSIGLSDKVLLNSTQIASDFTQTNQANKAITVLNDNSYLLNSNGALPERKLEYLSVLKEVYSSQGNVLKLNETQKEYDSLLTTFLTDEENKQKVTLKKTELINYTQNKILLLEKDRELNEKTILLLRKEQDLKSQIIERQQTITIVLVLGIIVVIVLSLFLYRNNKQKQRSNELLRLKSLRNQMNPHFIFNSLNSVNSFIASKDERSANKYLTEFSKLMRNVLEYSQEDLIPLSKEIEILELYMGLEHFRFKDNFEFSITIDKRINREEWLVPPMLIQPFLENAIWHGLRYKKEKGSLDLSFVKKENFIEVLIIDNGIGRSKSIAGKTINQKKMKSTGINNAKNRLEIIKSVFRKNIEVSIDDLNSQTKEGTVVSLKIYS
jgi:tetratricopeptide (TPR) repeat protein